MRGSHILFLFFVCILSGEVFSQQKDTEKNKEVIKFPEEKHFKSVRQLTFGGDNAEAYWSFDDKSVSFQVTNPEWNAPCDQIFYSNIDEFKPKMVSSTGKGRTTCSYFLPGDSLILYASTHEASAECPPKLHQEQITNMYGQFIRALIFMLPI
jgi:hypothetical protein